MESSRRATRRRWTAQYAVNGRSPLGPETILSTERSASELMTIFPKKCKVATALADGHMPSIFRFGLNHRRISYPNRSGRGTPTILLPPLARSAGVETTKERNHLIPASFARAFLVGTAKSTRVSRGRSIYVISHSPSHLDRSRPRFLL